MGGLRSLWQRLVGSREDVDEPLWPILLQVARRPAAWNPPDHQGGGSDRSNEDR